MAALYEINQEIELFYQNAVDPETGEIIGDLSILDSLQMARNEKIDNIACLIKNLKSDAEAIKAEEKKLADRRKACENRADWLKGYLAQNLAGEKYKSPRLSISWRKSESVVVPSIEDLDDDYLRFKEPEADKTKIKEAIKAGISVKGAALVENVNIVIK